MWKFWLNDEADLMLDLIKRTILPIDFSTSSVENYIEVESIFGIVMN